MAIEVTRINESEYNEILLQAVAVLDNARRVLAQSISTVSNMAYWQMGKLLREKKLNNYLVWNNIVEHKGGTLREKTKNILRKMVSVLFEEASLAVPARPTLPLLIKNQSNV